MNLKGAPSGTALLRAVNNGEGDMVSRLCVYRADLESYSSFRNITLVAAAREKDDARMVHALRRPSKKAYKASQILKHSIEVKLDRGLDTPD